MRISLFILLTIVFVLAKIFGTIDWSWWIVFLPLIGCLFSFVLLVLLGTISTMLTRN